MREGDFLHSSYLSPQFLGLVEVLCSDGNVHNSLKTGDLDAIPFIGIGLSSMQKFRRDVLIATLRVVS